MYIQKVNHQHDVVTEPPDFPDERKIPKKTLCFKKTMYPLETKWWDGSFFKVY